MKVPLVFLHCFLGSFMIMLISGCLNRSFSRSVSYVDSMKKKICINKSSRHIGDDILVHRKIPMDSMKIDSNRYTYNFSNKGSYSSSYYQVNPGDTLFYIAWITGIDYRILAKINSINVDSILKVGQILKVNGDRQVFNQVKKNNVISRFKKNVVKFFRVNIYGLGNNFFNSTSSNNNCNNLNKDFVRLLSTSKESGKISDSNIIDAINTPNNSKVVITDVSCVKKTLSLSWIWPTNGKIISGFSSSEGGNKGIDISGVVGQPVLAASFGKVVYAGNSLFGYGNLIIIKHKNDFLSTYAHNDRILVVEQQNVKIGEKIATMGNSDSDVTKLHFEIRYQGKSVNPLYYLPKK